MNEPAALRLTMFRREDFPHRIKQDIRFADLDRQNHVNNAVFLTFFESGRVDLLFAPENGMQVPGTTYVVARILIDYLGELHWPGEVEVGTRIERVGKSSLTLTTAVFSGDICVANGLCVLVLIDSETRKPRPFPAALAQRLQHAAPAPPGIA